MSQSPWLHSQQLFLSWHLFLQPTHCILGPETRLQDIASDHLDTPGWALAGPESPFSEENETQTSLGKFVDGGDDFLLFIITLLSVSNDKTNSRSLQKDGQTQRTIINH